MNCQPPLITTNRNNIEKWQLLLTQVEIFLHDTCGLCTLNQAQFKSFESQAGLILPIVYKNFCQVFGSGEFGFNLFDIDIPDCEDVEGRLASEKMILFDYYTDNCSLSDEVIELLYNAYLFGARHNFISFLFDLRTYSEQDQSCDIHAIECSSGFTTCFGRDFFKFIRDYCVGEKAEEVSGFLMEMPAHFNKNDLDPLYEPRSRSKSFIPYNKYEDEY